MSVFIEIFLSKKRFLIRTYNFRKFTVFIIFRILSDGNLIRYVKYIFKQKLLKKNRAKSKRNLKISTQIIFIWIIKNFLLLLITIPR